MLILATIDWTPALIVGVGIVSVLAMIIALRLNAFLALIISAIVVSLLVGAIGGDDAGERMNAVVSAFGSSAAGVGIVIAMAAVIGKCMLDSGSADRIVTTAVDKTGESKASLGLMVSGFVLAIPVFFDTVFYLLVPLARSLHRRTGVYYLRYLMAIATGGAITHTLVPPTPGPLLVAAILHVDLGVMMLVGAAVAVPSALLGLAFSILIDKKMPVPMRPLGAGEDKHQPLPADRLPSLWVSLLPVILPVALIGAGTLTTTLADRQDAARIRPGDIEDLPAFRRAIADAQPGSPASRLFAGGEVPAGDDDFYPAINEALLSPDFYDAEAFVGVDVPEAANKLRGANQLRMKPVDRRRMNRLLLEASMPDLVAAHDWQTPMRQVSEKLSLWSNPNFALLLAAIVAMGTLKIVRRLSWSALGTDVEEALMSGGLIILITAAGGAFGAMLTDSGIQSTISAIFEGRSATGIAMLLLAWAIAAVLKVAQGSSTVAMIIGAGLMAAITAGSPPPFNPVYVATAVGSGSLMGSWMNDSGFWVFCKMGGLTEGEALRSWTPLLAVLSVGGLTTTIVMSLVMPLS